MTFQISKTTKKTFLSILAKLGNEEAIKIDNAPDMFMALHVQKQGDVQTSWGKGYIVSLAHYYYQNGDAMADPAVEFLIVDNRGGDDKSDMIGIWPTSFRQDSLGIYQVAMEFRDGKTYFNSHLQKDNAIFCNMWLRNIKAQQKIK